MECFTQKRMIQIYFSTWRIVLQIWIVVIFNVIYNNLSNYLLHLIHLNILFFSDYFFALIL